LLAVFFLTAGSAWALEWTDGEIRPYVSVKGSISSLKPTGYFNKNSNGTSNVKDNINQRITGIKLAFGLYAEADMVLGDIRTEVEVGFSEEKEKVFVGTLVHNDGDTTYKGGVDGPSRMVFSSRITTVALNAYYDLDLPRIVKPYVGAGIGCAYIAPLLTFRSLFSCMGKSVSGLTYHFDAGISCAISDNIAADFGYRYSIYPSIGGEYSWNNWIITPNIRYKTHELLVGLRYTF
jgi:opacity protein-like surface antigen